MLETSIPLILCMAPPAAAHNRCHLLNRPCWRAWVREGLSGHLSQSGSWNWRHCWQSIGVPSPETFMLGESRGGVMFPSSVPGREDELREGWGGGWCPTACSWEMHLFDEAVTG